MNEIKVNLDNLTREERAQLVALVHKAKGTVNDRWKPENTDTYYYIDGAGNVDRSFWDVDVCDDNRYNFNNVFRTKEEAEKVAKQKRVLAKMQIFALENNDDDVSFLWNNDTEKRKSVFCIRYDRAHDFLMVSSAYQFIEPFSVYFTSEEIAQACINELGDEILEAFNLKGEEKDEQGN